MSKFDKLLKKQIKKGEQFVNLIKTVINSMPDEHVHELITKLDAENEPYELHDPTPKLKNISELKDEQIIDIYDMSDIPDHIDELHIPDDKGNIIWMLKGKDEIRAFFENNQRLLDEENKLRYDLLEKLKKGEKLDDKTILTCGNNSENKNKD